MQQTDTYKLNLIEGTDDFLPDPINENMEKLEEVVKVQGETMTQGLSDMENSIAAMTANLGTAGKNCRVTWGSYQGSGTYGQENPNTLTCDFVPVAVFISGYSRGNYNNAEAAFLLREAAWVETIYQNSQGITMTWSDHGVSWYGESQYSQLNYTQNTYTYVILGHDE